MSFFLVFLAVVLVAAVLWVSLGRRSRQAGGRPLPALLDAGFDDPPANLPPVLLPDPAGPEDVDRVRFSLGLRGYRMDQVDQVLDELRDQLAAKQAEIEELRGRLKAAETPEEAPESPVPGPPVPGSPAADQAAPERAVPEQAEPGSPASGRDDSLRNSSAVMPGTGAP